MAPDHSSRPRYERIPSHPENPFAALVPDQQIAVIPSFTLESGVVLRNAPLAYTARGTLNAAADNVMVVCHALTGSADVSDWWGPLLGGSGKALDISRFFVICMNSLGSPYGSASPVTAKDGDAALGHYGPEFPLTTIRDDVRIQKLLLDELGVRQVAAVIGGSLGGMFALEWAYLGKDYVRCVIPIATSSRHSAWCISWGEAQRQSIYADPKYRDGYYPFTDPPATGLAAARMAALLTYRSPGSFDSRFGRQVPDPSRRANIRDQPPLPTSSSEAHFHIHNDGHKWTKAWGSSDEAKSATDSCASSETLSQPVTPPVPSTPDPQFHGPGALATQQWQQMASLPLAPTVSKSSSSLTGGDMPPPVGPFYFSAQSYLRYQGQKFIKRFDSNCYLAMMRKLDTHDVSRGRTASIPDALAMIEQPTLILGIESDGLFTFPEQEELARHIPNARLERIISPEGHDAFLLQFEQVNRFALQFLREMLPDITGWSGAEGAGEEEDEYTVGELTKTSLFGEAEVDDITAW